jgi:threonylcarbamoyladenosine tRNA methylthiotransferase MtaB
MRQHVLAQEHPETIIINTCAVTAEAERQSRQRVRKARRANPNARVIVTGCSAQINPKIYSDMDEVDLVLGNTEKMQAESFSITNTARVRVNNIMEVKETALHLISGFESRVRAFIEIQNGCDHRCTFCTIPFGRGNNRSVPMGDIAQQINLLVGKGSKEVVFTGVDITGYGTDLPGAPSLGQMVKRVLAQCPDLERLRLSSIDPAEVDDDLMDLIAHESRLMPHFHISLQAGDDMILKRMKRRHLRHHIIEFCEKVRAVRPDAVFGADVIAGFPTETDKMFESTYDLLKQCDITYLHVFPYSPRPDTPAARMPQVAKGVIKARAEKLRTLGKEQQAAYFKTQVGQEITALMENAIEGHSDHFAPIRLEKGDASLTGQIVTLHSVAATDTGLLGAISSPVTARPKAVAGLDM